MDKKTYAKFADAHAPRSPLFKDCVWAFFTGGAICTLGQGLKALYTDVLSLGSETAGTLTSVTLILFSVLATALGVYDKLAKHAGVGTLVPITGFANAVVSPAIDAHAEGVVLGVGAKIFTVAGPVILYGTLAGAVFGVIEWIISLF